MNDDPYQELSTLVKKVDGVCISYMIPEGLMESFKANVEVEKNKLLELRKEIEGDHERKKAKVEAMQKDIDSQRKNLEAIMQNGMKDCLLEIKMSRMFPFLFIIVLKLCVDHIVI
ncbi:hypothetical protein HanPSC8_Chr16g0704721 [Helianthus annuus]|nr:hypothetical protein HanPSC8_Chr16g0704721 [Helianthus annuus]